MTYLKPPSSSTKPFKPNEMKAISHGQSGSPSQWTFSPLPTFRSRFCLQSQAGFIRDMSDPTLQIADGSSVFTSDPNKAQQYVDQDVAASKLRLIADCFPDLTLREVSYVNRDGQWFAAHG
jgi:hypothetical protein